VSTASSPSTSIDLAAANAQLAGADAADIVTWAVKQFAGGLVMSTSFGVQSAVMLHLVSRVAPNIPVIFIDTGFHFPETYTFADQLTKRLELNLKVYQPRQSPAWMVARHGQLWDQGVDGLNRYDQMRKVEPMSRALEELGATATLAGLRREQTEHRATLETLVFQRGRYKVHPIFSWTTRDVHYYLKAHDLPYHPLHEKGYPSIGDWHSTSPIGETEEERRGRFRGLKQECGLHLPDTPEENESRSDSML
jgi:phosphoadenosine phosphosulfate reductase